MPIELTTQEIYDEMDDKERNIAHITAAHVVTALNHSDSKVVELYSQQQKQIDQLINIVTVLSEKLDNLQIKSKNNEIILSDDPSLIGKKGSKWQKLESIKKELSDRGLNIDGKKKELVTRLQNSLRESSL